MKTQTKLKRIEAIAATVNTQEEWNEIMENITSYYKCWQRRNVQDKFSIGDKVTFFSHHKRYPGKHIGILIKKNPKRCKILVGYGAIKGMWHVPYRQLQIAEKDDITLLAVEKLKG